MRGKLRLKDARDGKSALVAVLIVIILIVSSFGVFLFTTGQGSSANLTATSGSTVKVNYIGQLPDGRVFDTSLYSVAIDDENYSKSVFFSMRGNETVYTPLEFVVGGATVIKGFSEAVKGLKVGESRTYVVTPQLGYGYMTEAKKVNFKINDTVPVYYSMTPAAFKSAYKLTAALGLTVQDVTYGWDVKVIYVDSTTVKLQNLPDVGELYRVYDTTTHPEYGWDVKVLSYDTSQGANGTIAIHHEIDSSDVRMIGGMDGTTKVLLVGVDEAAGTATLYRDNTYTELRGVEMTFTVTVVSIKA